MIMMMIVASRDIPSSRTGHEILRGYLASETILENNSFTHFVKKNHLACRIWSSLMDRLMLWKP